MPFIRNYTPEEYSAHNQNWAVVQDHRGVMYFGNNDGVLEYDGVSWRTIPTTDNNIIRSLAIDDGGRIYVGSYGDIGFLAPDSVNQLQYVSLLPKLDTQYHHFPDVWQTLATRTGIYFVTPKLIIRWDGKQMRVWAAQSQFHVGFEVNKEFFVRQWGIGLMQVISDSLTIAPLGENFGMERIMAMLPYASGSKTHILFATRNSGLLLYDGISIEPFPTEADKLFVENQIYCAAQLAGGQYAFGTLQNGVIIIDKNGRLLHHLNKATGLQDETIWYLYPDKQDGLWIGMHLGISRAETNSPLTYFGEKEGLEGSVMDIVRHNGLLYAATSMGIYYHDEKRDAKFHLVSGVSPQGWALLPFDDVLLAGTFDGVYEIRGGTGRLIDSAYAMCLARSQTDANRVFVGMHKGLKSLKYDNGKWRDEGGIGQQEQEILRIYESPIGVLWLTTRYNTFVRIDYSKGIYNEPVITTFDTLSGLPDGGRIFAFNSINGLRFGTPRSIYTFDEKEERFFPDTSIIKGLGESDLFLLTEDQQGNLWIVKDGGTGVAIKGNRNYSWNKNPFLRVANIDAYYAYPDPASKDIVWLGTIDRMIRYDGKVRHNHETGFRTLIRQVIANEDSLLYGGTGIGPASLTLKHNYKSLRFVYSAPTFDDESKTEYRYIIEGYDSQWSNWTTETYKDYTGLPAGNYRFLVRSRNIYQQLGETASIDFKILPPFYFSWWAYILYAIILAAFVLALWQMNLNRVRKHHMQELKQLELDKLIELDQLKSRFFADISHEFRTPLTLILGPVDNLLSSQPEAEESKQYHMIRRNAQRLLRLINQLLDLSKLEAGKMKLEMRRENIIPLLKSIVDSFESLAQSKKVRLSLNDDLESVIVNIDREKMDQVLINLISNAIKFTGEGGDVLIKVNLIENEDLLQINITDTGSGISKDQLPYVFDRFYQGTEAANVGETGSGIGLALAKELVELHHGRIGVSSIENQGTTFTITLPALKAMEVADTIGDLNRNGKPYFSEYLIDNFETDLADDSDQAAENTLLLVEDNKDMRAFIRESLIGSYKIIEAIDGQDGIDKALLFVPDIIISDVMMPKKDGLQLCEVLKSDERTSHIPIILLTAKADIESRLAGLERGANDYLAKPFNREELIIRSRNLLELRKRFWERYGAILTPQLLPEKNKDIQIEDVFLQKIRVVVEENFSESAFEIEHLAHLVGMSRSQLFRKIKALTGNSPSVFIRSIRLQKAMDLLKNTEKNITEVAYEVGFSTPAYFSDAFMETYGFRPSQLKK